MEDKNNAVTLGKFDGLHKGHIKLISLMKEKADKYNLNKVVFSFYPPPAEFFSGIQSKNIFTKNEKQKLLEDIGVDLFVEYPFKKIIDMPPGVFINEILVKEMRCKALVIGKGFRFGKNRSGDINFLLKAGAEYGIEITEIPLIESGGIEVSSSRIKDLLSGGMIKEANLLLGHNYFVCGTVAPGNKIGRTIGFPTINIPAPCDKFFPKDGVYLTGTVYKKTEYKSITNIGTNPTVSGNPEKKCETFITGFNKNIYGDEIKIYFYEFIRGEIKFNSVGELGEQIKKDLYYAGG